MSFKSFQEKVYIKNVNSIYRYIYFLCKNREVAEDVTAEAFTRLFERYKKNKSHVHKDIKNTKSYLLGIARNVLFDYFSYKSKHEYIDQVGNFSVLDSLSSSDVQQEAENSIMLDDVRKALQSLDRSTQEVIVLRIWEDLKFRDIASVLSEKESTVKLRYYRGIEKLKKQVEDTDKAKTFTWKLFSSFFVVTLLFSIGLSGEFKVKSEAITGISKNLNINNLFINSFYMGATNLGVSTLVDTFLSTTLGKLTVASVATASVIGGGIGLSTLTTDSRSDLVNQPVPQVIENRKDIKLTELRDQPIRGCVDINNYFRVEFPQDISGWECDQNQTYNNKKALLLTKNNHKLYIVQGESTPGYGIDVNNAISNEILLNEFDEQTSKTFTLFKFPNKYLGGGHIYEGNNKITINYILEGSDIVEDLIKREIVKILLNITFVEIDLIRPIVTVSTTTTPTSNQPIRGCVDINNYFRVEFPQDISGWECDQNQTYNNKKALLLTKNNHKLYIVQGESTPGYGIDVNNAISNEILLNEFDEQTSKTFTLFKFPNKYLGGGHIYEGNNKITINYILEGSDIVEDLIKREIVKILLNITFVEIDLIRPIVTVSTTTTPTPSSTTGLVVYNDSFFGDVKLQFRYDSNIWNISELVQGNNSKYINLQNKTNGRKFSIKYQNADYSFFTGNTDFYRGYLMKAITNGEISEYNPFGGDEYKLYKSGLVRVKTLGYPNFEQYRAMFDNVVPEWVYGYEYIVNKYKPEYGVKNWGTANFIIDTTWSDGLGIPSGTIYLATVFVPVGENFSDSELLQVDEIVKTLNVKNIKRI